MYVTNLVYKEKPNLMIDESRFRQVMGHFASGVSVVTSAHEGKLVGLTVSSFTSLSLKPMLVLVCVNLQSSSHGTLIAAGQYAVNILSEEQEYLSRRFASHESEKFTDGTYTLSPRGLPLLNGTLAQIECRLHTTLPGGDHTIFIGEVVAASCCEGRPLLYYRSGYHHLGV